MVTSSRKSANLLGDSLGELTEAEVIARMSPDTQTPLKPWIRAARNICLEQGLIGRDELDAKLEAVRAAFAAEGRAVSPGSVPYDRTEQP